MENERFIKESSKNSEEKKFKYSFGIMSNNESQVTNQISTAKYNVLKL